MFLSIRKKISAKENPLLFGSPKVLCGKSAGRILRADAKPRRAALLWVAEQN